MGRENQIDELRARIAQIEAGHLHSASVSNSHIPENSLLEQPCDGGLFLVEEGDVSGNQRKGQQSSVKGCKPKDAAQAYRRILRIVATREQSSAKVREKLVRAEFPPEAIDEAMKRAQRVGVVDDVRYCEALVNCTLRGDKGMDGVLREIASLGVNPSELDSFQTYLEEGEEGQLLRACRYLEAHPVRSKNKRDGAFRKLVSRGYSVSVASSAARSVYPYQP